MAATPVSVYYHLEFSLRFLKLGLTDCTEFSIVFSKCDDRESSLSKWHREPAKAKFFAPVEGRARKRVALTLEQLAESRGFVRQVGATGSPAVIMGMR